MGFRKWDASFSETFWKTNESNLCPLIPKLHTTSGLCLLSSQLVKEKKFHFFKKKYKWQNKQKKHMYFLLSTSEKKIKRERFKDSRCTKQDHFYRHKAGGDPDWGFKQSTPLGKGLAEVPVSSQAIQDGKASFWGVPGLCWLPGTRGWREMNGSCQGLIRALQGLSRHCFSSRFRHRLISVWEAGGGRGRNGLHHTLERALLDIEWRELLVAEAWSPLMVKRESLPRGWQANFIHS